MPNFIPEYLTAIATMAKGRPSIAQYLLDHGRAWNVTDATYKGRKFKEKMCFRNATILAQRGKGTYVEGYATCVGFPVEHAWIVDANGNVIDPTWRHRKEGDVPEYFGVAFDLDKLEDLMAESGWYGVFGHYKSCKKLILGDEAK